MAFTAAANGQLTLVAGSPFKVTGQMEDISGKLLISVGNTYLHTYPIESSGAIGRQISQINTANYGGSECGATAGQGSVLDHSGKYLYVQLNGSGGCAAWQSYRIEPDGFLHFIGDVEYYVPDLDEDGYALSSTPPTISSNDRFGYGAFNWAYGALEFNSWSAFQITAGGLLEVNSSFSATGPNGNGKYTYTPLLASADNANHLAVIENVQDANGLLGYQVASFTINPTNGQVSSTNDFHNMPFLNTPVAENTPITLQMSPSGKLLAASPASVLAVTPVSGLQIFHFNGPNPVTPMKSTLLDSLLPNTLIEYLAWDNDNHLYAVSIDAAGNVVAELYVFTVTPTSITQAPGSPYQLPLWAYGATGLIVTR
jgi:hypothetical protein